MENESNVGLRSQKGWKQGRVVVTVRGVLMLEKVWKQGRVVVTVHIAPWTHMTTALHHPYIAALSHSLSTGVSGQILINVSIS